MDKDFYRKVLREEYEFVSRLKKTEKVEISVWLNKQTGKKIILKKYAGNVEIYKQLLYLQSENLPVIYEVLPGENETMVLEEYVDGITVEEILETGLYTLSGACVVVREVCKGLKLLHQHNIVHRDIKPENIMVDVDGNVKVIDFDVARSIKENSTGDTIVMGTVGYAAPEQFGIAQSDQRSDIYSIGVLLNVMLTGEHPSKLMHKGKLQRVIKKCTRLNPGDRFLNIEELEKKLLY